ARELPDKLSAGPVLRSERLKMPVSDSPTISYFVSWGIPLPLPGTPPSWRRQAPRGFSLRVRFRRQFLFSAARYHGSIYSLADLCFRFAQVRNNTRRRHPILQQSLHYTYPSSV